MIPFITSMAGDASVRLIVAGLALAGAAIGGASLMADHKNTEISEIHRQQAEAEAWAAKAATARLNAAQRWNDALLARVSASESALQAQTEEKNDAIRRITVGRPCLGSAAVRVLNQPAGIKPAAVPAASAGLLADDAAFATDTDVGIWISNCRRSYDTCRGRLQAIADFFTDEAEQINQTTEEN